MHVNVQTTPRTVTKTGWASVRPESAIVGRRILNYRPRLRGYDAAGEPLCDAWIGIFVPAAIVEIGARWSDALHRRCGYHVRVEFQVPAEYANVEFV